VDDHCKAIAMVLEGGRLGEVYNVGGHNERNNLYIVKRIISEVARITGDTQITEDLISYVTDRKGHDRRYGIAPDKIKEKLEADALKSGIYVMVSDIKYLKKGGRITPMAAALASLLKIKPVLQLHEGKIDAYAKARTFKQAKQIMVEAIKKDLSERLNDPMCKDSRLMIAQYGYLDFAKEFASELEAEFGEVETVNLSLSVATHIGPGTVALAVARKISTD